MPVPGNIAQFMTLHRQRGAIHDTLAPSAHFRVKPTSTNPADFHEPTDGEKETPKRPHRGKISKFLDRLSGFRHFGHLFSFPPTARSSAPRVA
jgi:hypothetical protein